MNVNSDARTIVAHFDIEGEISEAKAFGGGHIHSTYRVKLSGGDSYTLQRINKTVFPRPDLVMENVANVTAFLRERLAKEGRNAETGTLTVVPCRDGKPYYIDESGEYWRLYKFIDGVTAYDKATPELFQECGRAFAEFASLAGDFPVEKLHDTIVDFHNTPVRFEAFKKAVQLDVCHRAAGCNEDIEFYMARESDTHILTDGIKSGNLPLRVTHNDTKINNLLISSTTGKSVCVIDLDTVMPGLIAYDFGDSIRTGASTGAEDESDLSKVNFSMEMFSAYTNGFAEGAKGLTDAEIDSLCCGARVITLEQGLRFLTDYLSGDTYYKTHREGQNLDRTRTQTKLVTDMEKCFEEMRDVVREEVWS